jgi:hypothetical protein
MFFFRILGVGILVFPLFLSGCVNLDEVAALSKLADGAKTTLPTLANDLKRSCERQNFYANPAGDPNATKSCSLGGS